MTGAHYYAPFMWKAWGLNVQRIRKTTRGAVKQSKHSLRLHRKAVWTGFIIAEMHYSLKRLSVVG